MAYGTSRVYKHSHPRLAIEHTGGRNLGRCYNEYYMRITSLSALSGEQIVALREAGFLGYGQGFNFRYVNADGTKSDVPAKLDWRSSPDVVPTGHYEVECSEVDDRTGEVLKCPSINPYSGEKDKPTKIAYYVYDITDTVDSGD